MLTDFQRVMPILFFVILLTIPVFGQEKIKGTVEIGDDDRKYRLYLPSNYQSDQPMPLVFNLHGLTSDAGQQQLYSQMNEVAEEKGFIVCYPKGKSRGWNVNFPFPSSKADDVLFISELLEHLSEKYAVDRQRVYACGFSNGGYMSYKLACELSDKIVAVASVAGTFVPDEELNCNPGRAVPILHIHGTADPIVRYKGSPVALKATDLVDFWRTNNGCTADPTVSKLPNTVKLDLSRATRYDFGNCENATSVRVIKVKNGGHTWPGAKIITGVTNRDFSASAAIWDFFSQFAFPEDVKSLSRQSPQTPVTNFKIFPNPTDDHITIRLSLEKTTTLSRSLYNLQGRRILALEQQTFPAGVVEWNYSLHQLPPGMYIVQIETGTAVFNEQLVIR